MVVGVLKKYLCFTHVKWSSLARHTHSCVNAPLIKIAIKQFAIIGKQANTDKFWVTGFLRVVSRTR